MYKVLQKQILNEQVMRMVVEAPHVARKARPGQFIMLRAHIKGERIPLTISDYDSEQGTVAIVFQLVGKSTTMLSMLEEGDFIPDFAGPLGTPSHLDGYKSAAVIGGGLGTAIAYPQAKYLHGIGAKVYGITGFRNKDAIILEEELRAVCKTLTITTDDGSNGHKGFVTTALKELIESGTVPEVVIAIGPLVMMRAVAELTRPYGIKTIVSLNSTMVDGTGMCGGCRVTVGGQVKFACVDGPEFDGHLVDFDEVLRRQGMYKEQEHACRLGLNG